MLDGCARNGKQAHTDVVPHPDYSWFCEDWYAYDPCTSAVLSPGWYAPDIVEWIRRAYVRHGIASHSFAYISRTLNATPPSRWGRSHRGSDSGKAERHHAYVE